MHKATFADAAHLAALFATAPYLWRGALADLTGWPKNRLDSALEFLELRNLLAPSLDDDRLFVIPDPEGMASLADFGRTQGFLSQGISLFINFYLLEKEEKHEAAIRSLLNLHLKLRALGQEATAAMLFQLFLARLPRISRPDKDNAQARFFVDLCIDVQPGYYATPESLQRFLYFLLEAQKIAEALGDRRSETLVQLTIGSVSLQCHSQAIRPDTQKLMQLGEQVSRELGDQDILYRVSYYLHYYDFFCGNFQRINNSFFLLPIAYQLDRGANRHIESAVILFRAACIAMLGNPIKSVKLLQRELGFLRYRKPRNIDNILRVQLAHVLEVSGRSEEAVSLLREIDEAIKDDPFDLCHSGVAVGLAYHHYLKGEVDAAHTIFYKAAEKAKAKGSAFWPLYFSPWQLELVFEFEKAGLKPCPGKEVDDVLYFQIKGVSRFVQGMALRLKAEQLFNAGADTKTVLATCRQALTIARSMSLPGETAKTHILLARIHLSHGQPEQALEDALSAAKAHSHTQEHIPWPEELRELGIQPEKGVEQESSLVDSFLVRYLNGLFFLTTTANIDEMHQKIVRISTMEFGAKKGELYTQPDAKSDLILAARFQEDDTDFHVDIDEQTVSSVIGKKPVVIRQQVRDLNGVLRIGVHLLIPFYSSTGRSYVLHLELDPEHESPCPMDQAVFEAIVEALSILSSNGQRVFAKYDEYRTAIGQASSAITDIQEFQFKSVEMVRVHKQATLVAKTDASVLITGESGVGKEVMARHIHGCSGRPGPFVAINLSSVPSELFESELFGYEKGAFTGAHGRKLGLMELAHQGTLFLDEIGDISARFQVKLLRALEEKSFMRVGGRQLIQSDFRLVAATNQDMQQLVNDGTFREDLYYRISVVPLVVPPLRNRVDDIIQIAEHYLGHFARHHKRLVPQGLTREQKDLLTGYSWPGNVRELKNTIERAVLLYEGKELHFPIAGSEPFAPALPGKNAPQPINGDFLSGGWPDSRGQWGMPAQAALQPVQPGLGSLPDLDELKKAYVLHVLGLTKGRVDGKNGAAGILGLSRSAVYKLLKRYDIPAPAR